MDIIVNVNRHTRMATPTQNKIGVDGENLQENLIFQFEDEFVDGLGRLEYEQNGEKHYIPVTKTDNSYTVPIKNVITKAYKIGLQLVITESEQTEGIPLFKTNIFDVYVADSINAVGEAPDDYDLWIDVINAKLLEMDNINIDADKVGKITTITITYKDGTTKEVELEDGMGLDYIWQGTNLGVKREDEIEYQYVNLKGDKGEPGAIKMQIVAELPQAGADDTIYLVPITPDISGNNYAEYVYINGAWELLGKIGVQVDLTDYYTKQETYSKGEVDNLIPDLTDYVKNTDYATSSIGGVLKTSSNYAFDVSSSSGVPFANVVSYNDYLLKTNNTFIGKGTLENVITGKGLTTKTYVDGLVGDINTALDTINGEVI